VRKRKPGRNDPTWVSEKGGVPQLISWVIDSDPSTGIKIGGKCDVMKKVGRVKRTYLTEGRGGVSVYPTF